MASPKGHPPYPGCETGGRPLEWTDDLVEKIRLAFEEWMLDDNNFWFGDFAIEQGIPHEYLSRFSKRNEKFRQTYKRAVKRQESFLFKEGLFNRTNATMSIFGLKCNHGWGEGQNRTGIEEEGQLDTKSTRALEHVTEVSIVHTDAVEQASNQHSASKKPL